MLQHAKWLVALGHDVSILGVTRSDVTEQGVMFLACSGMAHVLALLKDKYQDADLILINVTEGLAQLRLALPRAAIVEVCQNGPHFVNDQYIDLYALVGHGQFAYYTVNHKRHRHKFVLLLSVPPWRAVYEQLQPSTERRQIIWVGSLKKQGFRRWAKAMRTVMERNDGLKWVLCVPSYDPIWRGKAPKELAGLTLPTERIEVRNFRPNELAQEIARSTMLLASLGGEDGPVSYLDGHAAGVPVLCGDDIFGKFYNPEGIGMRCTSVGDCVAAIEFLLANPEIGRNMGKYGRRWIEGNFTEAHQQSCIEQFMNYIVLMQQQTPARICSQSDKKFSLAFWTERAQIKLANMLQR